MAKKGLSDEVTIKLKSKGCKGVSLRRVRGRAFKGMGAAQANALGKERGGPVEKKFKPISFSLFFFLAVLHGMRDLSWDQRSNLGPLQWKHGVLSTGPPGMSQLKKLKD